MTTEITFPWSLPGNNGKNGLLRMHWSKRKKLADKFFYLVRSMTNNQHVGPVSLKLTRYANGAAMDFDNLVSTGKIPVDSIVKCGVIIDDKPSIIQKREYLQERLKKGETPRTVIIIEDLIV